MAAKSMTYNEIISAIKTGNVAPVYILMGKETYYLDCIMDALEKYVIADGDRDFNLTTFYGPDAVIEDVVAAAQQFPFMADRQLVLLKEAQGMDKAKIKLEKLAGYMSHVNEMCTLAICFKGDDLNATSPMVKAAVKSGAVVFKSPEIKDYQLAGPINNYVASKKLSIEPKAVDMLIESIGNNLAKLFGEIDKLSINIPRGVGTITPEMVEKLVGISKEYNGYELTNALEARDFAKAIKIVDYYSKNPGKNRTTPIYALLFNFFSNLVLAAFCTDKSDAGMMETLKIKSPYQLKHIREASSRYPGIKPLKIISAIRDADCRSKGIGSVENEHDILKELIYQIFTI